MAASPMSQTPPSTDAVDTARLDGVAIAEYAFLSDGSSASLVSREGSIDWLCLPRFDSPAVFARILDPHAGHWSIRPVTSFGVERCYLPGTLALETTFVTATGTVRLVDVMGAEAGQRGHDLGLHAPHEVLRNVEGVSGRVDMAMELAPRPEYGLVRPLFRMTEEGGRTFGGPNQLAINSSVAVTVDGATMRSRFAVGSRRKRRIRAALECGRERCAAADPGGGRAGAYR